jgi:phospholipid/cholesterol/gamma-HCH transport system substrate-binding protein
MRVGVVLVVSLGLLAGGIWVLGDTARLWSAKVEYQVKLRNVQGLSEGSTVAVAGYRIGTVKDIYLPEDIQEGRVVVVLSVESANRRYLRGDTQARIRTIGLLGDKYIELSPGTPAAPELPPGSEIPAVQPPDLDALLAQGETVADNLIALSASLRRILDKVDRGEGLLGALISDTPEGRKLGDDFKGAVANLRSVSAKLDQGEGTVGVLLNDPKAAGDLRNALAALSSAARKLDRGEGLAAKLLNDPQFARELSENVEQAAREVRELTRKLGSGKGLIARLANDEELASDVLGNFRDTTEALASLTRRLQEGEGSLGKLMVDETLYQGLNDLLAGARKSWLARWFIARSQKSAIEERQEKRPAAEGASGPPAPEGP